MFLHWQETCIKWWMMILEKYIQQASMDSLSDVRVLTCDCLSSMAKPVFEQLPVRSGLNNGEQRSHMPCHPTRHDINDWRWLYCYLCLRMKKHKFVPLPVGLWAPLFSSPPCVRIPALSLIWRPLFSIEWKILLLWSDYVPAGLKETCATH